MQFPRHHRVPANVPGRGADGAGADALGFYLPPYAYAGMQVLGQAVEATKSLDQEKIAEYIHATSFKTMVGDVRFGKDGEWVGAAPHLRAGSRHQGQRPRAVQVAPGTRSSSIPASSSPAISRRPMPTPSTDAPEPRRPSPGHGRLA